MSRQLKYLDLFAGAGGFSEGFIRAGFTPIAHVERDPAACFTLQTRTVYHFLKRKRDLQPYADYLEGTIRRPQLYDSVPNEVTGSVINTEISEKSLPDIFGQIDSLLGSQEVDLIIGGPPCQTYSHIGRARCANRMRKDPRNDLYIFYAKFLKKYQPKYFVFENVPGLLSATDENGTAYLDMMRTLFHESGYETQLRMLNAKNYGIPQNRKRIILVGKRGKSTNFYPEPDRKELRIYVEDILSDLPAIGAGDGNIGPCKMNPHSHPWLHNVEIRDKALPVTFHQARQHNKRDREIYKRAVELWNKKKARLKYNELPTHLQTHKNKSTFLNRFKVVAGDLKYAHTIVAHIAMDGHYYIHPDIEQNRSLTPREAARLQTFPDDYYFESKTEKSYRTSAYRQIGNAVPVLLAQKIAQKLMENW